MNALTITTVQSDLHWEDKAANLDMFSQKLATLPDTDLIILPEMFTTGFTMNAEPFAETMDGTSLQWMADQAAKTNAVITGSLVITEGGQYYNRLIWMRPDGSYAQYDKRHLFAMAGEHTVYTAGKERLIIELNGWKICPLICYDLRFPVWARNTENYDLLIYIANWPERRAYAWRALLLARAIENQAYVVGINRVGTDGNNHPYAGDTTIIDPMGQRPLYQSSYTEDIHTTILSPNRLETVREKLPFLNDRDSFTIHS